MTNNIHYCNRLSDIEVIACFPDGARECLPTNIAISEKLVAKKKQEIIRLIAHINKQTNDEFTRYFCYEVIKLYKMPELIKCGDILMHQKIQWSLLNPNKTNAPMANFQRQIELAKEFPIYELARDTLELQQSGRNYKALCPFHNEKHASFFIFPETNTFYCFSCGESGDVIKLKMTLYGIGFVEAVQMLSNNYGK